MDTNIQGGGWKMSGGVYCAIGEPGVTAFGDLVGGYQGVANVRSGSIDYPSFGAGLYRCDEI
jgi:hypothetical protein